MPEAELIFDADTGRMMTVAGSRQTAKRDAAERAVLDYVASHPGVITRDIEGAYDAIGHSRNALRAARIRLVEAGALRVEGREVDGDPLQPARPRDSAQALLGLSAARA